jgi:hypothetical protein
MHNGVPIEYLNANGDNLLNPSTSGHYISKDVTLYKLQDEKNVKIPQVIHYGPKRESWNYKISPFKGYKDAPYVLHIGISENTGVKSDKQNGIDTILIRLQKGGGLDTLKAHYATGDEDHRYFVVDKIWYNGKLKWKAPKGSITGLSLITVQKPGRSPADSTQ